MIRYDSIGKMCDYKQEPEPVSRLYIAVSDKILRFCEEEYRTGARHALV